MMKRAETIKSKVDFNRIIKNGQYFKNEYYVIYKEKNENNEELYGIAISKKVGKAFLRNKLKRQTRAIIDKNRKTFKKGYNYIIMIRKNCADANYKQLDFALSSLIEK